MLNTLSFIKLLADETRLSIVLLLERQPELCVCEFTQVLMVSQPKISRHLAMLREAGVLATRRSGKWIHYSLSSALSYEFKAILKSAAISEETKISSLIAELEKIGDRPERLAICC
ncbi:metalloregulator ArsR/SmtB family transcription factor [Thalassotalea sp. M1531]|uniref:Metalloregulator ArsR/SmtB family transcription factor n=1 Tax=Thalassotalea algicola TaxID=2716224 RepID=A0A7Y0Q6R0_9GAMM|nr:metalloregulator ArsR/SmtB family transcription factor [Thalassotalea algicola]NMP32269.1 metalloregulator ArsR/SmtB family transcription factor [Thalassotalea algicola]